MDVSVILQVYCTIARTHIYTVKLRSLEVDRTGKNSSSFWEFERSKFMFHTSLPFEAARNVHCFASPLREIEIHVSHLTSV